MYFSRSLQIFEPIRRAWFVRPTAGADVPFFLPEQEYTEDVSVAMLVRSVRLVSECSSDTDRVAPQNGQGLV